MAELLPDLVPLQRYMRDREAVTRRVGGQSRRHVIFSNGVANYGKGPFIIQRANPRVVNGELVADAVQVILRSTGQPRRVKIGQMVYDRHRDHNHWHYADFALYVLQSEDGADVATGRKQAFCMIDFEPARLSLRNAPRSPAYEEDACKDDPDNPNPNPPPMGVSVGWADVYGKHLHGQYIDVTGVPSGRYWLESIFNPNLKIKEAKRYSNTARIRVRL